MKRPANHVAGDKGIAILKLALPDAWIKREVSHDYGVDMEVEIVDDEKVTGQRLWLQVKSVESISTIEAIPYNPIHQHRPDIASRAKEKPCIPYSMETKHLEYALLCDLAYLLVLVDLSNGKCYWLPVRDEVEILLPVRNPFWFQQQTATVYLPIENRIERGDDASIPGLRWYAREPSRIRSFWELQKNKRWFEMECRTIETISRTGVPTGLERRQLLREVARAFHQLQLSISIWKQLQTDGMNFMADSTIKSLTIGANGCLELLNCKKSNNACDPKCIQRCCGYIAFAVNASVQVDVAYDMFRRMFLHTDDRMLFNFDTSRDRR